MAGKQASRGRGATLRLINMQRALGQVSLLPFYATIWATCRRVGSMMCCCCLCCWQGFNNVSIIVGTDSHWQLKKLTKLLDWVIGNKLGNQQKKRQPGLYAAEWQVISFQHTHTHPHQLFISSLLARPQRRPLPTIDIVQVGFTYPLPLLNPLGPIQCMLNSTLPWLRSLLHCMQTGRGRQGVGNREGEREQ